MKTVKKVFRYLKKYLFFVILSMLLALVTVTLTLYVPILIGRAIDLIVYQKSDFAGISRLLKETVLIVLCTSLLSWIMNVINTYVTNSVIQQIRNRAIEKIQILPLKYLDEHPTGETLSRIITDVDQFADGMLLGLNQFFTGVATIFGTLFFMLITNKKITVLVVLVTPLSLFVANFIAKKTFKMFHMQSVTRAEQTTVINEMLGNEKVVKAYAQEKTVLKEFDKINDRLSDCSMKATFFSSLTNPCTRFINALVYALVALTGAMGVINGSLTVGTLTYFLSYANQYTKPFNEISGVITELQNALACAQRVFDLIDQKEEVAICDDAAELQSVKGYVDCNRVDFSYDPMQKLIQNFNLHVTAGETVAIVGPTGCGKTTLINLLMRFYDVNAGEILVDSKNIEHVTRQSLRKAYGMVLQETWLKNDTVKENIRFGKPDATDEEVIAAAKASNADSFICLLKDGYDTVLGEEGGSLSQGQKQLLCIARVMLALPPVLILDEATSSIDTRTEMKIQNAFASMMKGRTSFIVAHRLSTIQKADQILVMKDGSVIEQGNHEQLLQKNGFYANLYNSQQF